MNANRQNGQESHDGGNENEDEDEPHRILIGLNGRIFRDAGERSNIADVATDASNDLFRRGSLTLRRTE